MTVKSQSIILYDKTSWYVYVPIKLQVEDNMIYNQRPGRNKINTGQPLLRMGYKFEDLFSCQTNSVKKKKITKGVFGIISSVTKRENSKSSQGIGIT